MEQYAYTIIYDKSGNVIVCKKRQTCRLFNKKLLETPKTLRGGGMYCFPGGAIVFDEGATYGAARQLYQQTKITTLGLQYKAPGYASYGIYGSEGNANYGVFFEIPTGQNINDICKNISDNLAHIVPVEDGESPISTENWNLCPSDGELDTCEVVNFGDLILPSDEGGKYFDPRSEITGWFYMAALELRNRIVANMMSRV